MIFFWRFQQLPIRKYRIPLFVLLVIVMCWSMTRKIYLMPSVFKVSWHIPISISIGHAA